ncbi:putative peptidyl-prolyl cis-trans isomerase Cbf2 [Tepidimonas alkaliphilus]|uniref:peptidylprolyl isomerase n=1 Tax=Tepidimonas alkaliphilus TaxID=2588942 RepID=A0A554W9F0_9BURK|nr:putative peptidyl-prolyl cis-trans isomerase Cbf2 [Tepidimonas alkaliphilus]
MASYGRFHCRYARRCVLALAAWGLAGSAAAQALLTHPQAVVEAADLQAEWARLPTAQAQAAQASARAIGAQAEALLVRRVLARRAETEGLMDDPLVQRQVQLARERALSDAWLARLDGRSAANAQALEDYARAIYTAQPQRFTVPEQVRVRHILLQGDDAEVRARQLLDQLRAGADFVALAREHSRDPGSAANGGDLGFFGRGRMVPEFEQAAFALQQPGDLSEPVRTSFGVHILRLEQRRQAGRVPFEEVRAQLMEEAAQALRQQARAEVRDAILRDAKPDVAAVEGLVQPAGR